VLIPHKNWVVRGVRCWWSKMPTHYKNSKSERDHTNGFSLSGGVSPAGTQIITIAAIAIGVLVAASAIVLLVRRKK
jgi:LPXTG-motif cell wall-anchored protein